MTGASKTCNRTTEGGIFPSTKWLLGWRKAMFIHKKKEVIFTEAVPAVSQCARSKSASRADVLQAADETHPPVSKRETTPSFIIIHKTRPHKVWLPDEEGECMLLEVRHVYMCVCAFCSSTAACARENTALYSQKPGFWLLKNLSFLFFL